MNGDTYAEKSACATNTIRTGTGDSQLRLIVFVSSLGPGGAERVAVTLCNAWAARGDRVTLFVTYANSASSFYQIGDDVELVYLSTLMKGNRVGVLGYLGKLLTMRRFLKSRSWDLGVSFLQNVNVAAVLSSRFTGLPLIVCERSDPLAQPRTWYWHLLSQLTYPLAAIVTGQTAAAEAKLRKLYRGLKRVARVPNPVPEMLTSMSSENNGERKTLLSLGRLSQEKQVDRIVDAFAQVAPSYPHWDLHIYGDGPERGRLVSQIESLGLGRRVWLQGRTSEPWKAMARADIFVMASAFEGFPNALIEAMALALPCVAFDCPSGPREMLDNGTKGVLVPLNDQEALVGALRQLMASPAARATFGASGRKWVLAEFSLESVLGVWDGLFQEALKALE